MNNSELGKYSLISEHPCYCQTTDAISGVHKLVIGNYETEEDGLAAKCLYLQSQHEDSNPEEFVYLICNVKIPVSTNRDNIPF